MLKRIAFSVLLLWTLAVTSPAAEVSRGESPNASAQTATGEHGILDFDYGSAIWTLIIFLILLLILYKGAWKNVLAGLRGREQRIRNDLFQAEAANARAQAALADYNAKLSDAEARAREIFAKATADAQALAERIKTEADQAARDRADRAAKEIEAAKDQALREIYEQTADISTQIAEKILRRNLNANDQRDLVAQSLEQLQAVNRG